MDDWENRCSRLGTILVECADLHALVSHVRESERRRLHPERFVELGEDQNNELKTTIWGLTIGDRYRHKKRGSTYKIFACGLLAADGPVCEGTRLEVDMRPDWYPVLSFSLLCGNPVGIETGELQSKHPVHRNAPLVAYKCETDGRLWLRPHQEFVDGRFEKL